MSTTEAPGGTGRRSALALGALALGAFTIGTSELLVVGILNLVAEDTGVTISTAGMLVTAYALGISLGGPLISAATIRLDRRMLLWIAIGIFLVGNLAAALTVDFGLLIVARVITGSVHGLFIGVSTAVAASLVPSDRQGSAIGMVFGGIAVSTVIGVPLGTLLGQTLGWQSAFFAVVVLACVALAATLLLVPRVPSRGAAALGAQAHHALAPRVLALLGVGFLILGGQFTVFTYVADYLDKVTGVSGTAVSLFLLAFGVASAAGTFLGGRAADLNAGRTLLLGNAGLALAFAAMYFLGSNPILVALIMVVWGFLGFGLVPSLQLRVVSLAGRGGDLAATLGASSVNAGVAVGALIGGWAVAAYDVEAIVVVAIVILAVALPFTWASQRLQPDENADGTPTSPPAGGQPAGAVPAATPISTEA